MEHAYWLLDAGALTPDELAAIRRLDDVRWLYAHLNDEQAQSMGPVVLPVSERSTVLIEPLQQDATRFWAVAQLRTRASLNDLERHLLQLRYVHTDDGQRYYWRFADSRSLLALWPQFTPRQQRIVTGVICQWVYQSRALQSTKMILPLVPTSGIPVAPARLIINARQLAGMLQASWPDQLLYFVQENKPALLSGLSAHERHACAKRVADWLVQHHEDRYPVQTAMLMTLLEQRQPEWGDGAWQDALRAAHAQHAQAERA